ncbi:hypothetical protein M405DRAFT_514649 [Rhizopogon salebrosus TDB-379]|nr:hypothetical protein M405DRAFT_514649 [Rhizopogon salebrosus TDB-379]
MAASRRSERSQTLCQCPLLVSEQPPPCNCIRFYSVFVESRHEPPSWPTPTAVLKSVGHEDLLSIPDVTVGESIMDIDATQHPAKREHSHRLPRGFFDDARDSDHFPAIRERHIRFSIPPEHSLSPSPQSRSRALIGRFSSIFRRPPLKAHGLTGPQQRRRQSISSNHSPRVVEVSAGRDKQTLYVAPRRQCVSDKVKDIKNPSLWTRCVLFFICASPQSAKGHQ